MSYEPFRSSLSLSLFHLVGWLLALVNALTRFGEDREREERKWGRFNRPYEEFSDVRG